MQSIGNGPSENAEGLRMQGIQCTGGHVDGNFAGKEQILIKDEFQLLISLIASLDHTGAGVELEPTAGFQVQFGFHRAAATLDFGDFFISQRS